MSTEGTVTMSLSDYEAIMVESDAMKRRLEQRDGDSPNPMHEAIYRQLRLLTIHATTMEARIIPELLAGLETLHRLFGGPKPKPLKVPACDCLLCQADEAAVKHSLGGRLETVGGATPRPLTAPKMPFGSPIPGAPHQPPYVASDLDLTSPLRIDPRCGMLLDKVAAVAQESHQITRDSLEALRQIDADLDRESCAEVG